MTRQTWKRLSAGKSSVCFATKQNSPSFDEFLRKFKSDFRIFQCRHPSGWWEQVGTKTIIKKTWLHTMICLPFSIQKEKREKGKSCANTACGYFLVGIERYGNRVCSYSSWIIFTLRMRNLNRIGNCSQFEFVKKNLKLIKKLRYSVAMKKYWKIR